jgi:hypothetical protein
MRLTDFKEPVIIDDAVPLALRNEYEGVLSSSTFPWFFMEDVTFMSAQKKSTPGFFHMLHKHGEYTSSYFTQFRSIPLLALDKFGITEPLKIFQSRGFLQLPLIRENEYLHDNEHRDFPVPHLVCLYYVNDTDGDTFLFGTSSGQPISKRITPKKGRIVLFDGSIFHASSMPTKNKRIILNYDIEL